MKRLILLFWICISTLSCASLKNIFAPEQPKDIGEKLAEQNLIQAQKDRPQFKIFKPCPSDVKPTSYFSLYKSGGGSPTFVELRNITPKMIVQKTMEKDRAFDQNFVKLVVNLEFKDGFSIYRTFSVQDNSWTRFSDKLFTASSNEQFKGNLPNTTAAEYSNGVWTFPDSPYLSFPQNVQCSELMSKSPSLAKYLPAPTPDPNSTPVNPLDVEARNFAQNLITETFNKCDGDNWYSTWVTFESRLFSNDWSKKDLKIESRNGVIKLTGFKWDLASINIDEERKRRGFQWEGDIKLSASSYQTNYFDPKGSPPKPYLSEVNSGYPSSTPTVRIGKFRDKWGMLKDGAGSIKFPVKRYLDDGERDAEQNIADFLAVSCADAKKAFPN